MMRNRIYYRIKPFLPGGVRLAIRRWFTRRMRSREGDRWPIFPGSERPPADWPGWPGGKKFAVVLTHDVESRDGLEKCRKLMHLDAEFGFRSSFNFIPEGNYRVPRELREEITRAGFEIGIHDLKHDGHLYQSRREFKKHASRINWYLKEWGAAGFRSGFMLHNLDWLHELKISYDASTFDTDPFEPQPEGRHTIFPFWVPRPTAISPISANSTHHLMSRIPDAEHPAPKSAGYVELPYTLPQDSTLFLLLGETAPTIWLRKLDWIAAHGGMVLVNVHPDYIQFEGEAPSSCTYPVSFYREFLAYLNTRYAGQFWQPLAREVSHMITESNPRPRVPRAKRICMVTHSFYESDNRVTRYAEALAAQGDHVDVFALRRSPKQPARENIHGVHLVRIQDRFTKDERSRLDYLWPLLRFLLTAAGCVTRAHRRERYDLVHIHNVPDFMVFAAWYPKLTGTPVILDIHDIVPEFFVSKFQGSPRGMLFRLLLWMERVSAAFADHIIIANHLWLKKYAARTHSTERCSAFINNVDSTVFSRRPRQRSDGKQIILFPGGLQWHQGVDIALQAFQLVRSEFPSAEFHIYGDGSAKESLIALAAGLGLNGSVKFRNPLGVREIAGVMAEADLGIVPKRADSFGNEAYSTKIMEFMSVGVPVVVSNTKVDRYYFNDSVVRFFESGKPEALAEAILEVLRDRERREEMVVRAAEYSTQHSWESRKGDYLRLVDSLCEKLPVPSGTPHVDHRVSSILPGQTSESPVLSS